MSRTHNFSAGPATLPISVIEDLQAALPEFKACQAGIMEISHRSQDFDEVIQSAKRRLKRLLKVPNEYEILFLQGGASLQFYMLPLNILSPQDRGAYIMTGTWSTKALKEAKRCSDSIAIWEDPEHRSLPQDEIKSEATYVHYTSNNTIYGTQFHHIPNGGAHTVVDMSSDICSRQIDVSKFDIIYAGAQKNLGPSGVTAVILSPWAIEQSKKNDALRQGGIPSMLNYALMVSKNSMFNTPNTFGIFALERMLAWLEDLGGVHVIEQENKAKAKIIYQELDSSDFWKPHAHPSARSEMNITWRLAQTELEPVFVSEAASHGLLALKGHRSVGGIRASLYNACRLSSAMALADFMKDFRIKYG